MLQGRLPTAACLLLTRPLADSMLAIANASASLELASGSIPDVQDCDDDDNNDNDDNDDDNNDNDSGQLPHSPPPLDWTTTD